MTKITKLHPKRRQDSDLFDVVLGEVAVEKGFKLPETEEELEIYERRIATEGEKADLVFRTIHEALAHADAMTEVRHTINKSVVSQGGYKIAARNGEDDIDEATISMMDAVADKDDD